MNVLHIGKYYHPFHGGIENFTKDLVEIDAYQQQVEPYLLVHHHKNGLATVNETLNGVAVTRVKKIATLLYSPISLSFLSALNKTLAEFQPDVLHIHLPNLSAFWCLLSTRARNIPWVLHWHADVLGSVPDWRIKLAYYGYRFLENLLLQRAKAIIVTSPPYLLHSKPLSKFKHKCRVIPLGLAAFTNGNKPLLSAEKVSENNQDLSLLIIGRLTYYKGHQHLINALSKVTNAHLTIIGIGELEQSLIKQVQLLGLENRVRFLGSVSNNQLNQAISQCDLLCLPSIEKTEAFGMVILEAARLAKPALVTSVEGSGMSWVVQDKKTGIVVAPNSVNALIHGLDYAQANSTLLVEYGKAAQQKFDQQFAIDAIAKQHVALYKECCNKS